MCAGTLQDLSFYLQRELKFPFHSLIISHGRPLTLYLLHFMQKIYIGEMNDNDASKPVELHFNLPDNSQKHMVVCGLSLHLGNTKSRKTTEQKLIFQIGTVTPSGINERGTFHLLSQIVSLPRFHQLCSCSFSIFIALSTTIA